MLNLIIRVRGAEDFLLYLIILHCEQQAGTRCLASAQARYVYSIYIYQTQQAYSGWEMYCEIWLNVQILGN